MEKNYLKDKPLELTNDGKLTFFFLGIGSAFSKLHYQTNLLIIKGQDHVLIDCGTVCPTALHNYKSSIINISNFLITHSHADHIGGLEESALMGRYVTKKRPNMIITDEYKDLLWNSSLKGGLAFGEIYEGKPLEYHHFFNQIKPEMISKSPRPLYEINAGSINIKLYRTMHIPDSAKSWSDSSLSYGILVDNRVIFSSDTRFDIDLINWLLKDYPTIEHIFHDCQFFPGGVHASFQELSTLDPEIKKMINLCHYGDNYKNFHPRDNGFAGFARQGCYYIFN
ncbi:MAG: hypothetical protein A2015_16905 [Spirochaetes bacterium GWF1_31_7]|nr:MAG: hypothetical protein A2Y30_14270 [Spirochaetes bacterium GWE1_32_154]OHD50122.1 MAG: hypothetical protein A2Y29_12315 [Spirochaetes bacterium GWE2_31_10]OHD52436.1 MAG: hypothetical protein A2015_16905 [Spirochaetes bacterium GWF1_31_7]OHD79790.1 MAG: hypothetical protein A2355_14715 [Spirochaetes bacterium RIFOXYB1_FULL_32_8]HBD96080.1 hypothetical protein [Spirochaetia bacterium]